MAADGLRAPWQHPVIAVPVRPPLSTAQLRLFRVGAVNNHRIEAKMKKKIKISRMRKKPRDTVEASRCMLDQVDVKPVVVNIRMKTEVTRHKCKTYFEYNKSSPERQATISCAVPTRTVNDELCCGVGAIILRSLSVGKTRSEHP